MLLVCAPLKHVNMWQLRVVFILCLSLLGFFWSHFKMITVCFAVSWSYLKNMLLKVHFHKEVIAFPQWMSPPLELVWLRSCDPAWSSQFEKCSVLWCQVWAWQWATCSESPPPSTTRLRRAHCRLASEENTPCAGKDNHSTTTQQIVGWKLMTRIVMSVTKNHSDVSLSQ